MLNNHPNGNMNLQAKKIPQKKKRDFLPISKTLINPGD
jgi:hypothetical protein